MGEDIAAPPETHNRVSVFDTTHWSVILQAGAQFSPQTQEALQKLCAAYWYPLYVHVRRAGWSEEDAKDLTQQFFARFLERKYLERADPERGRFRSFLLTSLKHFLANEWEKARAQKRGGRLTAISWDGVDPEQRFAIEPKDDGSPDRIYERRWAATLVEGVLECVRSEYVAAKRVAEFDGLKNFIWGDGIAGSYAEVAGRLQTDEAGVKAAVYRLRKRFRDQLRQEVSRTVSAPEEVEAELRHLISVLAN